VSLAAVQGYQGFLGVIVLYVHRHFPMLNSCLS
jgi:hypothetical protein